MFLFIKKKKQIVKIYSIIILIVLLLLTAIGGVKSKNTILRSSKSLNHSVTFIYITTTPFFLSLIVHNEIYLYFVWHYYYFYKHKITISISMWLTISWAINDDYNYLNNRKYNFVCTFIICFWVLYRKLKASSKMCKTL